MAAHRTARCHRVPRAGGVGSSCSCATPSAEVSPSYIATPVTCTPPPCRYPAASASPCFDPKTALSCIPRCARSSRAKRCEATRRGESAIPGVCSIQEWRLLDVSDQRRYFDSPPAPFFFFFFFPIGQGSTGCRSAVPAEALTVSGITPEVLDVYPVRKNARISCCITLSLIHPSTICIVWEYPSRVCIFSLTMSYLKR